MIDHYDTRAVSFVCGAVVGQRVSPNSRRVGWRAGQGAVGCEEGTRGDDAADELTVGRLENKQVTGELKAAYSVVENRSHADG